MKTRYSFRISHFHMCLLGQGLQTLKRGTKGTSVNKILPNFFKFIVHKNPKIYSKFQYFSTNNIFIIFRKNINIF